MTKEELKQEAREKYHNHKIMEFQGFYNRHYYYLGYLDSAEPREKRIAELEKENAELKANNQFLNNLVREKEQRGLEIQEDLLRENEKLKAEVGSSIDCEKAQKNGELCLGYSGDEDEPCERCKNCIKCEGGYYQLGETEKDEQLTKAKEILEDIIKFQPYIDRDAIFLTIGNDWKEVIFKAEQFIKDSEVKK